MWQWVDAVCKKNLILLSTESCTELLWAMRIYAANVVSHASLVDSNIGTKAGMCLVFHLPEPPQPYAQAALPVLETPLRVSRYLVA